MDDALPPDEPDYETQLRDRFAVAVLPAIYTDWIAGPAGTPLSRIPERAWGMADLMLTYRAGSVADDGGPADA